MLWLISSLQLNIRAKQTSGITKRSTYVDHYSMETLPRWSLGSFVWTTASLPRPRHSHKAVRIDRPSEMVWSIMRFSGLTTETLLILSSAGRSGWRPLNSTYTEGYLYKIYRDSETTMLEYSPKRIWFCYFDQDLVNHLANFCRFAFLRIVLPKKR